ncbi:hypothetical protein D3C72_1558390 [compost metagenome]
MPVAEDDGTVKGFVIEVHRIDVHPGAGQLHFVARLQMTEAAEARQQPAHGQGRRGFHAQDVVFGAQGIAGAFKRGEAFANARQQQTGRLGQLQVAATAMKQAAGKMLFERTNMPADRTLGNRQLFGRAGKRTVPRRRFECAQGIQGRKTTGHWESSYCGVRLP